MQCLAGSGQVGMRTFLASVATRQPCKYLLGETDKNQQLLSILPVQIYSQGRSGKGIGIRRKIFFVSPFSHNTANLRSVGRRHSSLVCDPSLSHPLPGVGEQAEV